MLRFTDLGQARHALRELKRLDRERQLRVSVAALVERPGGTPTGSGDAEGFYVPRTGIVGILVDAISGPAEALYAEPTETFRATETESRTRLSASSCSTRSAGLSSRASRS